MRRRARPLLLAILVAAGWLGASVWQRSTLVAPRPTALLTDRNGVFMAQLNQGPEGYGYWPVTAVPDRVAAAILALEDRRFYAHPGIDPIALARAALSDITQARRVSGASTLAMQVARMQHPEARSLPDKAMEALTALVMTARYGRTEILEQYLTLAPFGQNSHGIAYAAQTYFDRPVADLSWAQIALLAAIPQAPSLYNPGNPAGLARAKVRARLALIRLAAAGVIDPTDAAEAEDDLAAIAPLTYPHRPPAALHAILRIAALTATAPPALHIRSTIDLALQARATRLTRQRLFALHGEGARQAAVIILDRSTMQVLALVGSAAYAQADSGMVDYAIRWRSPGSTLKPFIFAQALDRAAIFPSTILNDSEDTGTTLEDADRRFMGPLLPAQALANSRNVPAAGLVRLDGLELSHWYLARELGLSTQDLPGAQYGLTLAIGGMPTTLERLVTAYGALANGGTIRPLRWYGQQPAPPQHRVMSAQTAALVTLFLADPMARLPSFSRMGATEFPFPVAVKTGTSQGYRDAWVVEYDAHYLIGVWVGRPDGTPMNELGGATSAALIGQDILTALDHPETDGQDDISLPAPANTRPAELCATSGEDNAPCAAYLLAYLPMNAPMVTAPPAAAAPRIVAPLNHADFILNPDAPPGLAVLALRTTAAGGAVEWFVDGTPYRMATPGETLTWPAVPGRHVFVALAPQSGLYSKPVEVMVQ